MMRTSAAGIVVWAILAGIAALIVTRAHYTTDLSAFLPTAPTAEQRMLVDQLREGVASRLIIFAIEGADSTDRARASRQVAQRLRADTVDFLSVNNGDSAGEERDREFLFAHRYLLSESVTPVRFTTEGLTAAIQDTLDLLASPAGMLAKSLLPRDPTGEMAQIIGQLSGGQAPRRLDGVWASRDGRRALLVAQTRAAGSDTDGQGRAVDAIKQAFAAAVATSTAADASTAASGTPSSAPRAVQSPTPARSGPRLRMTGPGVFSVAARATIKHQVTQLSILSTALTVTLLLAVYRSVPALLLGMIPVASGALAGIAAVALGFGVVHGITLGFGVTLIGEAVDYSIYLFVQSRQPQPRLATAGTPATADTAAATSTAADTAWRRRVWPTIRLGMLTSICGFMSLLPSGFPGLAQLGLYSIAGLVAAGLVTRFVLPNLLPRKFAVRDVTALGVAVGNLLRRAAPLRLLLALIPVVAAVVLYTHRDTLWNRELAALSPVSAADQDLDAQLRADLGAPDVRYLVVVTAPDRESALQGAEQAARRLEPLVDDGAIAGFQSPSQYLPSAALQRARQASLPAPDELRQHLRQAVTALPVRLERLEPFVQDVADARQQPLLTRKDLEDTSLAAGFDALTLESDGQWHALLPLTAPVSGANAFTIDIDRVRKAVSAADSGHAVVLDLKGEADKLYSTYLSEAVRLSLAGFAAIVILLLIALRSPMRVARAVAPLGLSVLAVASGLALAGCQLTILHVIGMLLIVAVGSNYALFFDRRAADTPEDSRVVPLTLASLFVANLATVLSFGVLACSTVPVLSALGSTVAPGAFLALCFSALLAGPVPLPQESTSQAV